MISTEVYCTAPWNGITVQVNGEVTTCCAGRDVLGNLNSESISNIINNKKLNDIRNELISGNIPSNCFFCKKEIEINGFSSLRNHYLKYYKNTSKMELKMLDIRWSNICNLACVYCGPELSSTWSKILNIKNTTTKREYNLELLEFILDHVDTVNEILLVGGEPLLMKQNHVLFEKLNHNAQISIITNLSVDLENMPAIKFLRNRPPEKINWNVSLENTHKQFEYIRNGASWDVMVKNLKFLTKHWPTTITIEMVYNVFSALTLDRTIEELQQFGNLKFTLQTISDYKNKNVLNPFAMPDTLKELFKQALTNAINLQNNKHGIDAHLYPIANADDILQNLNQKHITVSLADFEQKLDDLDRHSTSKCRIIFKDQYNLIKKYLK